ncbi:MAG: hypothetical protein A4E32_00282 [Methanomassiliicoccales archaeon PtaU1.Bin124]|nr:MAG: hypothetical protein A4E32_00282 [Methanomassiliicoccales archaeon PtaU1.Bin124]
MVDLYLILGVWLLLGVLSAFLVYLDMRDRKNLDIKWILICIPLSAIGFIIYVIRVEKSQPKGRELPPKPDYGKPEYKFAEQPEKKDEPAKVEPEKAPEPKVEPVVEAKVETKVETAAVEVTEPAASESEPAPEPEAAPTEVVQPVVEEVEDLEPPNEVVKPVEEAPRPKMQQIEGIPRCPNCRAAVSSFDEKCPICGTKLKG